jgi:hypothetical protein
VILRGDMSLQPSDSFRSALVSTSPCSSTGTGRSRLVTRSRRPRAGDVQQRLRTSIQRLRQGRLNLRTVKGRPVMTDGLAG